MEAQRASTRSASMRTLREWAANPKRRRCSAWNRRRSSSSGASASDSEMSLSPARSSSSSVLRDCGAGTEGGAAPRAPARSSRARRRAAAASPPRPVRGADWRGAPPGGRRHPTPRADNRLASGCTRIRRVPAARATRQACWPAAPPKQKRGKSAASSPWRVDTWRIAFAMASTPTSRNASASPSAVSARGAQLRGELPRSRWRRLPHRCACLPSRAEYRRQGVARRWPSSTWASVRVRGPPRP